MGETNVWMKDMIFLIPNWKWIGLAIALFAGILIQNLLRPLFKKFKNSKRLKNGSPRFVAYLLSENIHGPLAGLIAALFWHASLDSLQVVPGLEKYLGGLIQLILCYQVIRLAYFAAEALGKVTNDVVVQKTDSSLNDQLAPLFTKTLKVFVVLFGLLIAGQSFGVNVVSLLAGLGLGGLALALAAQDTAANLFGSVTIILDRPFQIGEWVKVGDTEGVVEEIGFRSTRIRTLYNSLITVPNASMAKERIDNLGARPSRRLRHTLGFTYDSTEEQLKSFMDKVRQIILKHPQSVKENISVAFNRFGDSSLEVLVNFFIVVSEAETELKIQQEILFEIMKAAKDLKLEFAFPTQTHYMVPPRATSGGPAEVAATRSPPL